MPGYMPRWKITRSRVMVFCCCFFKYLWSFDLIKHFFYVRRSCAMLPHLPMSFSVPQPIDRVQLSDCPSDVSLPILEAPLLTTNRHQPLLIIINYYEPSLTIFLTGITPTFLPWDASPTQASRWASTPWRAWNLEKPKDFHPSWQKKCEIGKLGAKKVLKDVLGGPTKDQNKMKKIKNPNPYSPILLDQVIFGLKLSILDISTIDGQVCGKNPVPQNPAGFEAHFPHVLGAQSHG